MTACDVPQFSIRGVSAIALFVYINYPSSRGHNTVSIRSTALPIQYGVFI